MNKLNYDYNILTPFKLCVLENFPFIEADFDALTNYQIMCKMVEYINSISKNQNLVQTNMIELNNWFNNLDVQEEINNKLDEMAESGELEEIISEFLHTKALLVFDTVSDMISSPNLINGSYAKTLGYNTLNDGGTNVYKIEEIISANPDGVKLINLEHDNLYARLITKNNIIYFDTVQDMLDVDFLVIGDIVETLGFYSKDDGGNTKYEIIENTENANGIDILQINNKVCAKYLFNNEINLKQIGAKDDGITDNKNIIDRALELLPEGGVLYFPNGVYQTSGNHNITTERAITIKGNGKRTTHIKFIGSNYCFYSNGSNDPIVSIKFENMRIDSYSTTENNVLFKLSDRWGYELKDILSYGNDKSIFCEFYNNNYWTEGGLIENCMIRSHHYGIVCNRNTESSNNTNSFFNVKILKTAFDLNQPGARAINLGYLQNANYPINCYNWNINITVWFGSTGGGKQIINVGSYNTLTGIFDIIQDGTAGIVNGSDMNSILVQDNGFFDGKGQIRYQQGNNPISDIAFSQILKQTTIWQFTSVKQPLVHLEGAKILIGGIKESGTEPQVIYTSGFLPTFSSFRIKVTEEGNNGVGLAESILITKNANVNIINNIIAGSERLLNIRPINNGTPGGYQVNNGLQFEIYLNTTLTSLLSYNIEIEML